MSDAFESAVMSGLFAIIVLVLVSGFITIYYIDDIEDKIQQATIAGVTVPAVACEEDQVISWVAVDTLGCIHYEEVR